MSISFFTSHWRLLISKDIMTYVEFLLGNIAFVRPVVGIGGCSQRSEQVSGCS